MWRVECCVAILFIIAKVRLVPAEDEEGTTKFPEKYNDSASMKNITAKERCFFNNIHIQWQNQPPAPKPKPKPKPTTKPTTKKPTTTTTKPTTTTKATTTKPTTTTPKPPAPTCSCPPQPPPTPPHTPPTPPHTHATYTFPPGPPHTPPFVTYTFPPAPPKTPPHVTYTFPPAPPHTPPPAPFIVPTTQYPPNPFYPPNPTFSCYYYCVPGNLRPGEPYSPDDFFPPPPCVNYVPLDVPSPPPTPPPPHYPTEPPLECLTPLGKEFPQVFCDVMKINWTDDIMNKYGLNMAMNDVTINMIRFAVATGYVNGQGPPVTVVGDQNHLYGDLSMRELLETVVRYNEGLPKGMRKGVKIKFPKTEYFLVALPVIEEFYFKFEGLLVLNADIVKGPETSATQTIAPVNGKIFLEGVKKFSLATVSIGWTSNKFGQYYTEEEVNQMMREVQDVTQPVTFTIRAKPAVSTPESMALMIKLANCFYSSTLSIWSSAKDKIDIARLNELVRIVGRNRIYFTVKQDWKEKFKLLGLLM